MEGIAPLLLPTEIVRITHALSICALGLPYAPFGPAASGALSAATRVFRHLPAVFYRSIANGSGRSLLDRKRYGQHYARRKQRPCFHRPSPSARYRLAAGMVYIAPCVRLAITACAPPGHVA